MKVTIEGRMASIKKINNLRDILDKVNKKKHGIRNGICIRLEWNVWMYAYKTKSGAVNIKEVD